LIGEVDSLVTSERSDDGSSDGLGIHTRLKTVSHSDEGPIDDVECQTESSERRERDSHQFETTPQTRSPIPRGSGRVIKSSQAVAL